jgi:hypothetical protein
MGRANPGNLPKKKKGPPAPERPSGEIVLYRTEDGLSRIQVRLQDETVWLTQRALADLYEIATATVTHHISTIYDEVELAPEATTRQYLVVQDEGGRQVRRALDHYNLDMVLAIGYRVRSSRGTQFRQWATERLREYLVKGFTLDDERLKEGRTLAPGYFASCKPADTKRARGPKILPPQRGRGLQLSAACAATKGFVGERRRPFLR